MTTPPSAQHRVARSDAFPGDAPGRPSQDVRPFELRSRRRMDSKVFSILVILHYLLKNNTTFMGGMKQEKSVGVLTSSHMTILMGPPPSIGGSLR